MIPAPALQFEYRPCPRCGAQTADAAQVRCQLVEQRDQFVCPEGAQVTEAGLLRFPTPLYVDRIADWCEAQMLEDLEGFAP